MRNGLLTQLGRDGAGILLDVETGIAYGFAPSLLKAPAAQPCDGQTVRFRLAQDGSIAAASVEMIAVEAINRAVTSR